MKTISDIKKGFKSIPAKIKSIPAKLSAKLAGAKEILTQGNGKVTASLIVMGLGQLIYKQWVKGFMFLFIQAAFIVYFVLTGATDLFGFFTLGMRSEERRVGKECRL